MSFNRVIVLFWIIFAVVAAAVSGGVIAIVFSIIAKKRRNDRSPRLSTEAVVLSKRTDEAHQHQPIAGDVTGAHGFQTVSFTTYFILFQTADGGQTEFQVDDSLFDQINEGDHGRLEYQGTRLLAFVKN